MAVISGNSERPKKIDESDDDLFKRVISIDTDSITVAGDFYLDVYGYTQHGERLPEELINWQRHDVAMAQTMYGMMQESKKMSKVWLIVTLVSMVLGIIVINVFSGIYIGIMMIIPGIAAMFSALMYMNIKSDYEHYKSQIEMIRRRWEYLGYMR